VASPQKVALIADASHDLPPEELAERFIRGADIIVAEGFKQGKHPKVEVYRRTAEEPLAAELENLIAVVTDEHLSVKVPCISLHDIPILADIIEEHVMYPQRETCTRLWVDGKLVALKPFPKSVIAKTVEGMVSSLRGCASPEEIEIRMQLKGKR